MKLTVVLCLLPSILIKAGNKLVALSTNRFLKDLDHARKIDVVGQCLHQSITIQHLADYRVLCLRSWCGL